MKMQSSLNQSCVDCFVAHCHKCSFQPANILVFTSSLNGMCCWAAKKMHYNINIRNLISRINQFSIYVLKAVLSIFALLIKCFFSCVCMSVCPTCLIYLMSATFARRYSYWERSQDIKLGHYMILSGLYYLGKCLNLSGSHYFQLQN